MDWLDNVLVWDHMESSWLLWPIYLSSADMLSKTNVQIETNWLCCVRLKEVLVLWSSHIVQWMLCSIIQPQSLSLSLSSTLFLCVCVCLSPRSFSDFYFSARLFPPSMDTVTEGTDEKAVTQPLCRTTSIRSTASLVSGSNDEGAPFASQLASYELLEAIGECPRLFPLHWRL
jgi:hypothetical protein